VHTPEYLETLKDTATWLEIFEFKGNEYIPENATEPLPNLIEDLRLKSGGTKAAAVLSLETGLAASLGGGYHHAFADRGRGYCVINDVAIAIRSLQKSNLVKKVMIVDLDFHQGDGTARIFKNDDSVFTMSVHSDEGWPDEKQISDLDVPVKEAETGRYQELMEAGVSEALRRFAPDMVLFIAGSDAYEKDVLPGTKFIKLSLEAMKERDFYVIDKFAGMGIPLAMVFAGGYGPDVWEVHYWATRRLLERAGIIV
jgi:acetoin utilization deacetylase AcuC-like enzyme